MIHVGEHKWRLQSLDKRFANLGGALNVVMAGVLPTLSRLMISEIEEQTLRPGRGLVR
jgi:hypothetical protein